MAELSRKDITQTQAARFLEMPQNALSARLHGRVEFRLGELLALCGLLGITFDTVLASVQDEYSGEAQKRAAVS
ncbi:helix-turn-helix domain-containing protein [Micrococcaceae sp. AOP34-BR2-30]